MTPLEQIQQDIQTLTPESLNLVSQFIQLLKKSSQAPQIAQASSVPTASIPDVADWSDFIGCVSAESDLSINYKAYIAEGLEQKYGDR